MARATRSPYVYNCDTATAIGGLSTQYVMLIPAAEAADTNRGWTAPASTLEFMPRKMKPRTVHGKDGAGHSARVIVADVAADLWTGAATTFVVNGVTYTVTGFSGERRTIELVTVGP